MMSEGRVMSGENVRSGGRMMSEGRVWEEEVWKEGVWWEGEVWREVRQKHDHGLALHGQVKSDRYRMSGDSHQVDQLEGSNHLGPISLCRLSPRPHAPALAHGRAQSGEGPEGNLWRGRGGEGGGGEERRGSRGTGRVLGMPLTGRRWGEGGKRGMSADGAGWGEGGGGERRCPAGTGQRGNRRAEQRTLLGSQPQATGRGVLPQERWPPPAPLEGGGLGDRKSVV